MAQVLKLNNNLRSPSVIRVVDAGTANIAVANLAYDGNETVNFANIKRLNWSSNGYITITRNGEKILDLSGSGELRCDDFSFSLNANNTYPIMVTIVTGGSLVMEVSKDCTYATPLVG